VQPAERDADVRGAGRVRSPLHELTVEGLTTPGTVYHVGLPPVRADVLTRITGVEFDRAWHRRLDTPVDDLVVPVIGRAGLLENKRALGRTRDLADVELLEATETDWVLADGSRRDVGREIRFEGSV
jgi:hypothetical protein